MKYSRWTAARLGVVTMLASGVLVSAQLLPSEPAKQFGASITPAFEGWFDSPDGSHNFLIGYLNRNRAQDVDIPIGPNNRIEPGGPDLGQPTHFKRGRYMGAFIINVPKTFTLQQRVTWSITVNGVTQSIPFRLHPDYVAAVDVDASGNKPPVVRFEENGPTMQGPLGMLSKAQTRTAKVGTPLSIPLWVEDDAIYTSGNNAPMLKPPPPVSVKFGVYRGNASAVSFDKEVATLETIAGGKVREPFKGKATTVVTFKEPGEYILQGNVLDYWGEEPGGGGEYCCWTNPFFKVTVTP